jgi:hypothetical protein
MFVLAWARHDRPFGRNTRTWESSCQGHSTALPAPARLIRAASPRTRALASRVRCRYLRGEGSRPSAVACTPGRALLSQLGRGRCLPSPKWEDCITI